MFGMRQRQHYIHGTWENADIVRPHDGSTNLIRRIGQTCFLRYCKHQRVGRKCSAGE